MSTHGKTWTAYEQDSLPDVRGLSHEEQARVLAYTLGKVTAERNALSELRQEAEARRFEAERAGVEDRMIARQAADSVRSELDRLGKRGWADEQWIYDLRRAVDELLRLRAEKGGTP